MVTLFYFDPNLVGEKEWQRLGLSDRQIRTLMHYTAKGGRFRSAADLEKIYGLSPEDKNRLIPYVRIPKKEKREQLSFVSGKKPRYSQVSSFVPQNTSAKWRRL